MDVEQLQDELLDWYQENKRDLPWRRTDDPYEVLVAEIMLQQTQVSRVVPKWEAFLDRFPTVEELADAPLGDVLELWDGLGYNNRAKYLKQAAEQVVDEFGGEFPRDPEQLEELQGVGEYTANAVASFAFNNGGPVFDTNVRRLLYRFHGAAGDDELKAFHEQIFPEGESRVWNNAVMELGAEVCVDGTPRCRECPWRQDCTAFRKKNFETPDIQSQSSFEGSWRQYRAKVLKLLMDAALDRDAIEEELALPDEYDLDELLAELQEEGMIEETGGEYRLPS
ncbi:MAG: A/G-specific adenine glycosylase [Candidatus Nanohaloarchaea archaeon]|nr:A/G-specific adenine glycosylase [Candidatus Nanohaloarchaea archaeon]